MTIALACGQNFGLSTHFLAFPVFQMIKVCRVSISVSCSTPPSTIGLICTPDSDSVPWTKLCHQQIAVITNWQIFVGSFTDDYLDIYDFVQS